MKAKDISQAFLQTHDSSRIRKTWKEVTIHSIVSVQWCLGYHSTAVFYRQPVKQQVCNAGRIRNITKKLKTQLRSLSLCLNENMPIVLHWSKSIYISNSVSSLSRDITAILNRKYQVKSSSDNQPDILKVIFFSNYYHLQSVRFESLWEERMFCLRAL